MSNLASLGSYYVDCNGQIMFVQQDQVYLVGNQLFHFNDQQYLAQIPTLAQQQLLVPQAILPNTVLPQQEAPELSSSSFKAAFPSSFPSFQQSQQSQQEVDELVNLTNLLYQPTEVPCNTSEVADIAFDLLSSLPSSPKATDSPTLSPSSSPTSSSTPSMQFPRHIEHLPSIDTLSEPIDSPHLAPFKKQYSFVSQQPQTLSLPSLSPSLLPPIRAPRLQPPSRVAIPSPQSPASPSPPHSPKRSKKNYTKEFNMRFHELLNHNEDASNQWHLYSQKYKSKCTIKRAPCIKVSRGFCASYGQDKDSKEFTNLAKEERYGALGTRTECECGHKPAPLVVPSSSSLSLAPTPSSSFSSSLSPSLSPLSSTSPSSPVFRKLRGTTRSTPYPSSHSRCNPSTPQDLELPSSPQDQCSSSDKWLSMLVQNAPLIFENFNNLGGMQCTECKRRKKFSSGDEVTAYLMGEGIPCSEIRGGCSGHFQLNVRS